ncbi:tail fiber protein [Salmonella enterica subsp. enterica serovar Thompson]|uniref:phage tail protein n=1 Tax=Citrobacter braakii TaxID=57706 RepID=UPI0012BF6400|nr:tail fiber protein [Salmonella enterica subsp. enterica serovar Thompson]ECA3027151.1 tail fiber protein [Salmonella enterica subsp. enterica serovar Thompson]EGM3773045.1 tail fiber protein [Salmonella enterica subsp. enterica serovar Thompson]EHE7217700.1 tail fiber protein [Salmonella enterica subsp. enterica serovar Thompson]EHG1033766.1 tail fiber protein [Salmonella enterica subsp. enterica serovar Thompson]
MGEGSALPVGVPVPWPLPNPPEGWLKYNGAPFDKNRFPKLGAVYPAGVLPDLRGEFIRSWDDGKGVDSGRLILSHQEQSVQQHTHDIKMAYSITDGYRSMLGGSPNADLIPIKDMSHVITFTGSGGYYLLANNSTGDETRPRNLSFNYIVRAM